MREDNIVLKTEVLDIDSDEIESTMNFVNVGTMEEIGIDDEMEEEEESLNIPGGSVKEELEEWLGGEGETLIHGRAALISNNRGDLFSPNLEQKLKIVLCNLCGLEMPSLSSWRSHCLKQHLSDPGYGPKLIREQGRAFFFNKNQDSPHQCPRCNRCFSSDAEMEEHHHSAMRTVRLICSQCNGQYGDMETHMKEQHARENCDICGDVAGAVGVDGLVYHVHKKHKGFRSVIAETSSTCTGDGVTLEVFETVLETHARFLATEVKPQLYENAGKVAKKFIVKDEHQVKRSWPITFREMEDDQIRKDIENGMENERRHQMLLAARKHSRWRIAPELGQCMTEEERYEYNVRELQKFRASGVGLSRNECEICGFLPYTKNKYREKQDHLAKFHFKEKIDSILPAMRPYNCPDGLCDYVGKDRQDVLRHYTGKHNVLKNWVDTFLREQLFGEESLEETSKKVELDIGTSGNKCFTFHEMERIAIEKEKIATIIPATVNPTCKTNKGRVRAESGLGVAPNQPGPSKHIQNPPNQITGNPNLPNQITGNPILPNQTTRNSNLPNQITKNPNLSNQMTRNMFMSAKYEKTNNSLNWDVVSLTQNKNGDISSKVYLKSLSSTVQDATKVRCSYCDTLEVFANTQRWKEHCEKVHREISKQKVEEIVRKIGRYTTNSFREDKFESGTNQQFLCKTCGQVFFEQNSLDEHKISCIDKEDCVTIEMDVKLESLEKEINQCMEPPKKKVRRPPPPLVHIDQIKNFTAIQED